MGYVTYKHPKKTALNLLSLNKDGDIIYESNLLLILCMVYNSDGYKGTILKGNWKKNLIILIRHCPQVVCLLNMKK